VAYDFSTFNMGGLRQRRLIGFAAQDHLKHLANEKHVPTLTDFSQKPWRASDTALVSSATLDLLLYESFFYSSRSALVSEERT
jgi:hypothetical protein